MPRDERTFVRQVVANAFLAERTELTSDICAGMTEVVMVPAPSQHAARRTGGPRRLEARTHLCPKAREGRQRAPCRRRARPLAQSPRRGSTRHSSLRVSVQRAHHGCTWLLTVRVDGGLHGELSLGRSRPAGVDVVTRLVEVDGHVDAVVGTQLRTDRSVTGRTE